MNKTINKITNPILRGFNPDPSICRVGDDYYIATSTFEWYPGVQIHHSRDLKNWQLIARPLNRADLLDMTGCPDSCGVWAPCLTWHEGLFYLVYTDVKRFDGNFKDTHNYLTTCERIDGEWSPRIYLNSSGFDPSLFHDDDGKKYLLNMVWDHRPERSFFGGIVLQEYSPSEKKLIGSAKTVFTGSALGITEGPHLYKINQHYYLLTAEGGTGYNHAVTLARSKSIFGPYEVDPIGHFISAKDHPECSLQRAGHADLVQTKNGEWYAVHLCSRPLDLSAGDLRRSPMGRETAMQKIVLNDDGWFRLQSGDPVPQIEVDLPALPEQKGKAKIIRRDFNEAILPPEFQWLRLPDPSVLMSLNDRPGYLRLYGRESIGSLYHSALVARRQSEFTFAATCKMAFSPHNFQQMAGLICYYNSQKFHYLYISFDEEIGVYLGVMSCLAEPGLHLSFPLNDKKIPLNTSNVFLRADVDRAALYFSWSTDGEQWNKIDYLLDYSVLSDEAGKGEGANFTGAFVGMCCQDLSGGRLPADFSFFEYSEITPANN